MSHIDQRGRLEEEPFAYHVTKNGKVFIAFHGKVVTILQGKQAQKFVKRVERATIHEAQLVMAKATGNFKRGNERQGRIN